MTRNRRTSLFLLILLAPLPWLAACGEDEATADADPQAQAILDVKTYVTAQLAELHDASAELQAAAPAPDADGWGPASDAAAVDAMKNHWRKARSRYERVEGAIAVLFPDLDEATDQRYDGFLEAYGPDDNLFDDQKVTGVHGVERILWADAHPVDVVAFEQAIPGYQPPAFPASEPHATDFKGKLLARLVADTQTMLDDFEPLALDPAAAYGGVVGSMEEQFEKASLAQTGQDESRYAQHTLGDMRANLEGGQALYAAFRPWLTSKDGGADLDARITARFNEISALYDELGGDAIPPVPSTWDPDAPSDADLATDYGRLYDRLSQESDPANPDGLVSLMLQAAELMGIVL